VGADRVFELARHLTWRDREIALCLYDHQVLSTGQLQLLFFSSKRRCQDRLLFLYRHRVLDRFYPPGPFGSGKPQAHWLLDEAGAILVAASMGIEPKQLGWSRRNDWSSHRQLAHRLEANQFVCELIAATLHDTHTGVTAWESTRRAAARLDDRRLVRPDASLILDVPAGAIDCFFEGDRATETQARLAEKIEHYQIAEARLRRDADVQRAIRRARPGPDRDAATRIRVA
jgi:protein involved in plasmid replication-relaxation